MAVQVKNYLPSTYIRIDDPRALQKFLTGELKKIALSIQLLNLVAQPSPVTFAKAPVSPLEGTLQPFTDSTTAVWGATITGGGTNHVLGYFDGTNWTVAAK